MHASLGWLCLGVCWLGVIGLGVLGLGVFLCCSWVCFGWVQCVCVWAVCVCVCVWALCVCVGCVCGCGPGVLAICELRLGEDSMVLSLLPGFASPGAARPLGDEKPTERHWSVRFFRFRCFHFSPGFGAISHRYWLVARV